MDKVGNASVSGRIPPKLGGWTVCTTIDTHRPDSVHTILVDLTLSSLYILNGQSYFPSQGLIKEFQLGGEVHESPGLMATVSGG